MPILRCYVSDDTMRILEREAERRGNGETPEILAESAIADAAIRSVPPPVRQNFDVRPDRGDDWDHRTAGRASFFNPVR